MSLRSMTGYGRGVATEHGLQVEVEISSVNRKQLDIQLHMPQQLRLLESRVQEEIAEAMSRGRIVVEVAVQGSDRIKRDAIRINEEMAEAYLKRLRKTASRLKLRDDFQASLLLKLPGVLHHEPLEDDVERIWPGILKALNAALNDLLRMRIREGASLQKDLEKRAELLEKIRRKILKLSPLTLAKYRESLKKRLLDAGVDIPLSDERIVREIVLYTDKCDITEELTRLDSHLKQVRQLLRSKEPSGRSLDFLSQEMYREINTIGSKANDATISEQVISFKSELERLREQVQNIE